MKILQSGCCLLSSIGCLTIGLVIGGIVMWFFYPQLSEEGYASDDVRYKAIQWLEQAADASGKASHFLKKEAQKEKTRLDSATENLKNQAEEKVEQIID